MPYQQACRCAHTECVTSAPAREPGRSFHGLCHDLAERAKDAPKEVQAAAEQLTKSLSAVEEQIYQVRNQSGQDPLNFPIKTNNRLASLLRVVVTGEGRPTGNVEPIFQDLVQELAAETEQLNKVIAEQVPPLNRMLERNKRKPIEVK